MKSLLILLSVFSIALVSCQKEAGFSDGTGGAGNTNGDLLVKAWEISLNTNDTNTILFQWDANKRLLSYSTNGKVSGIVTDIKHLITRLSDGKISKIKSTSSLTAGFVDSIIYTVEYVSGNSRLAHTIATQYTFFGVLRDSIVFAYNGAGKVSSKETFTDFFGGGMERYSKDDYTYDAAGNVLTVTSYAFNGLGYDLESTSTFTYNSHKASSPMGDEAYIALGVENVSPNYITKLIIDAEAGGTDYTINLSNLQFNASDRPTQASMTINPQPPGYDLKLLYFYQ